MLCLLPFQLANAMASKSYRKKQRAALLLGGLPGPRKEGILTRNQF